MEVTLTALYGHVKNTNQNNHICSVSGHEGMVIKITLVNCCYNCKLDCTLYGVQPSGPLVCYSQTKVAMKTVLLNSLQKKTRFFETCLKLNYNNCFRSPAKISLKR